MIDTMKTKYYSCKLNTAIVLNSSLATEGNMRSLDYIPGSNFLGIVAAKLYAKGVDKEKAMDLFHNGRVCFGDASISKNNQQSFHIPFSLFTDKLRNNPVEDPVFLHHELAKLSFEELPERENGQKIQLKQCRNGYILEDGTLIEGVEKSFTLKSAYDRKSRTSADAKMFGLQTIEAGQIFNFQIDYKDQQNISIVENALLGDQRIGKSKNAEFGQVHISELESTPIPEPVKNNNFTLVYAQSHLCFTDEFGAPTFKPSVEDLGLDSGEIVWEKCQIRTHSYSPWNGKRNTPSLQRHCISMGSVFYVKDCTTDLSQNNIGHYKAEGLGRVLYNPFFLLSDQDPIKLGFKLKSFKAKEETTHKVTDNQVQSPLTRYLAAKLEARNQELKISKKVRDLVYHHQNKNQYSIESLKRIPSSQWGSIRSYANNANDMAALKDTLFGKSNENNKGGYLNHGVADLRYWGRNRGRNKLAFEKIFQENNDLGPAFIAKFAAEMAKESKNKTK